MKDAFKLIGKAMGHSFGMVSIIIFTVVMKFAVFPIAGTSETTNAMIVGIPWGVYTGGYALYPIASVISRMKQKKLERKAYKKYILTDEFKVELSEEVNKKLGKVALKDAKKQVN